MGALDRGMTGNQLPGSVPVTNAAPASDDMPAAEQGGLEVERVEATAASPTGAAVDELENQAPRSRRNHQAVDDALVDGDAGAGRLHPVGGWLQAAGDVSGCTVPEPLRDRSCHHCR